MYKWGIGEVAYTPLPTGASVSIAADAALDLGGMRQTVAALSVAADGIVTNGSLIVTSEPAIADGACAEAADNGDGTWTVIYKAPVIGPATDDEDAEIEKKGDGSYKITVQAEEVAITIPAGVTVSEVVVSTNTTTVTGFPAGAAAKVAVSWVGGSANYEIVKVVDGAVLLDDTKSVTVGAEEIPVVPAFADAGDAIAPLDVQTSAVTVGVKAIPGLVYRLVRGTSVTGIETPVAAATATGARVGLADSDPPENAAFYRVTVSLK